jgi:hypothetical protein
MLRNSRSFFIGQAVALKSIHNSRQSFSNLTEAKSTTFTIKHFPSALRNFLLMKFLQYPQTAKLFARISIDMINRGGLWQKGTEAVIRPLTKSFSVGDSIPDAIIKAHYYLNNSQYLLLDLVEEMVFDEKQRALVFQKFDQLLDEIKDTSIQYLPLKLTGIISPSLLIKASKKDSFLSLEEKSLLDAEFLRLEKFIDKAVEYKKIIFIDQEYPHQKNAIFKMGFQLMLKSNYYYPAIYMTVQATDKECFDLVKRIHSIRLTRFPAIKLVNGAYVDWAFENNYIRMMQSSKARTFIAFTLIAKFCLKEGIHLFLGTHNPILEKLIDAYAQKLNVDPAKYMKGQLYGFKTQMYPHSMYALFGPPKECIHYSLRRVTEGADSSKSFLTPLTSKGEVQQMIEESGLMEQLSDDEISQITTAFRLDLQQIRVDVAKQELYQTMRLR